MKRLDNGGGFPDNIYELQPAKALLNLHLRELLDA